MGNVTSYAYNAFVSFHWPVVVGDQGTVALAEWDERAKVVLRTGPVRDDGLDLKLYDKTGRELASCPIGRFLHTNRSLQEWVFQQSTLFVGEFDRDDAEFYFATTIESPGLYMTPELHCLKRDGELLWRGGFQNVMPSRLLVLSSSLIVIGEADDQGERAFVEFDKRTFQPNRSGQLSPNIGLPP